MTDGILALSSTTPDAFEPMVFDGENHGLVHWVRNDVRNGHEYRAAVWMMPEEQLPYESPYVFSNDETFTVLQGELEITWADGTLTVVREGDIISVAAGTTSDWRITKPFKKFVVEVQL
jgi:uncharacterized cupin superfamily protein